MRQRIFCNDFFKVLRRIQNKSVDIIITDPPYDFNEEKRNYLHKEFLRVSKTGYIVFCPPENQWNDDVDQYCFWIKPTSTKNTSKRYSRFVEMILLYGKLKWNNNYHWSQYTNIFTDLVENTKIHPYAKPVSLLARLIRAHTDIDDLILDPFAGIGSVGIAAKNLNRNYIGYEISYEYAEYFKKRNIKNVY